MEKSTNPWFVSSLEEFQYYCCPECEERNPSKDLFLDHALNQHSNAKEYLQKFMLLKEEDENKSIKSDIFIKYEDDLHQNNSNENNPINEKTMQTFYDIKTLTYAENIEESKSVHCEFCIEKFYGTHDLKKHIKTVHEQLSDIHEKIAEYNCHLCEKIFGHEVDLRVHVRRIHEGVKNHECEHCKSEFGRKEYLIRHIKRDHQGIEIKDFKCNLCEKAYTTSARLKYHIKNSHEKTPPELLRCELCQISFKVQKYLETHLNTVHKGIKYFNCKDCDKAFTYVHKLKRHVRVAHEGVKLKCEFCGKDLKPECLKSHILRNHP